MRGTSTSGTDSPNASSVDALLSQDPVVSEFLTNRGAMYNNINKNRSQLPQAEDLGLLTIRDDLSNYQIVYDEYQKLCFHYKKMVIEKENEGQLYEMFRLSLETVNKQLRLDLEEAINQIKLLQEQLTRKNDPSVSLREWLKYLVNEKSENLTQPHDNSHNWSALLEDEFMKYEVEIQQLKLKIEQYSKELSESKTNLRLIAEKYDELQKKRQKKREAAKKRTSLEIPENNKT